MKNSTVSLLATLLADTYVLYVKTQNFHWNIEDPRFYSLHKMLEGQYEELAEANDLIAERIRAVGEKSPGSMKEFLNFTNLTEADENYTGHEMIEELYKDHQTLIKSLHSYIQKGEKTNDDGTVDLFIQRLRAHEKTAWMLKSHLA